LLYRNKENDCGLRAGRWPKARKKAGVIMPNENVTGKEEVYAQLIKYIKDIRFGSVTVVIQDGKIVQIEKSEKIRLR
jgi:hypothetical protein